MAVKDWEKNQGDQLNLTISGNLPRYECWGFVPLPAHSRIMDKVFGPPPTTWGFGRLIRQSPSFSSIWCKLMPGQAPGKKMVETRKLAAILAADVVGFSRLGGADEDRTLARLRRYEVI